MKRLIPTFAVLLGLASAAWAAAPAELTTLRSIVALTNAEADKGLPVAFEATVTYRHAKERKLFVQEDGAAIFVNARLDFNVAPGDRILVRGTTAGGFRPVVDASSISVLRHGALPTPVPVTFDDMSAGLYDCMRVRLDAVIHTADMSVNEPSIVLKILTDGVLVDAVVDGGGEYALKNLLDARVQVTGVVSARFDGKKQRTGIMLHIASLADVKILQQAASDPWLAPVTPMDEIYTAYHIQYSSQRTRVQGIITYYQPGAALVLQKGSKSLWIATQSALAMRVGDQAIATGFPDVRDGFLALKRSEIQDTQVYSPITPLSASWRELASKRHQFDLVSIEGQVIMAVREATQDEYVLSADGHIFSALFRHPQVENETSIPEMMQVPLGSKVRVSGICMLDATYSSDRETPFNILMRTYDDFEVIAKPSPVNTRNLLLALALLLAMVLAVGAWGWTLRRKVRLQTAALAKQIEAEAEIERRSAQLERRRSRILEDINGSRPLAEVIEGITEMVSFELKGAPCWCAITDGSILGVVPPEKSALSVVHLTIAGRSGSTLGTLFAALDPYNSTEAGKPEALSVGTHLAALAIETRRLYSDLHRRSEFDLLTDIPNRFAMEKFIELQIEEARQSGRILGMIYIDLDKFKLINDTYGHHVGDLYLQAVAQRMSRQLLGGDLLARLGGDEFAVLASLQHGRTDLEKIVARLEHCFDKPFAVEGIILHGKASIGFALYPEDGASKDSLLSAADAAMYAVKKAKRQAA